MFVDFTRDLLKIPDLVVFNIKCRVKPNDVLAYLNF